MTSSEKHLRDKVDQDNSSHSLVTDSSWGGPASLSTGMKSELQASSNLWTWLGLSQTAGIEIRAGHPIRDTLGHLVLLIKADTEYTRAVGRPSGATPTRGAATGAEFKTNAVLRPRIPSRNTPCETTADYRRQAWRETAAKRTQPHMYDK